jgi:hypothetical protein
LFIKRGEEGGGEPLINENYKYKWRGRGDNPIHNFILEKVWLLSLNYYEDDVCIVAVVWPFSPFHGSCSPHGA